MLIRLLLILGVLFLGLGCQGIAFSQDDDDSAITVPTPQDVVARMLQVAKVTRNDTVYDLGSGDGRIVITAAETYGCHAVGYDINPRMIRLSKENVKKKGLESLVRIEQKDIFKVDLRDASVITLYLLPEMNEQLVPQLKQLKAGCRIVCHEFPIDGFEFDQKVTLKSRFDGVPRDIYLYVTPLRPRSLEP